MLICTLQKDHQKITQKVKLQVDIKIKRVHKKISEIRIISDFSIVYSLSWAVKTSWPSMGLPFSNLRPRTNLCKPATQTLALRRPRREIPVLITRVHSRKFPEDHLLHLA